MKPFSTIKKELLIEVTTEFVAKERAASAELIRHLRKIERRRSAPRDGIGKVV